MEVVSLAAWRAQKERERRNEERNLIGNAAVWAFVIGSGAATLYWLSRAAVELPADVGSVLHRYW